MLNNKNLMSKNYTHKGIVSLRNNDLLRHNNRSPRTSEKYLHKIFAEEPTPSLILEKNKKEEFYTCVSGNDFLQTLVAYANGANFKGLPKYADLGAIQKRIFDNGVCHAWITYYCEKEAQNA